MNDDINKAAQEVHDALVKLQRAITDGGVEYLMRLQPYFDDADHSLAALVIDNREGKSTYHQDMSDKPGPQNPLKAGMTVITLKLEGEYRDGMWQICNHEMHGLCIPDGHGGWTKLSSLEAIVTKA